MHASIHGVFVSASKVCELQAVVNGRNLTRYFVTVIFWSTFGSSPAFAQGTYLGKWNSRGDVKQEDRIPQLSGAHNRTHNRTLRSFRPIQEHQRNEFGSVPSSLSNHQQEQPGLLQTPDDVPLLIPETPSEGSFTALESGVNGSELIGPDSRQAGRLRSISQPESPGGTIQRGFKDLGGNGEKVNPDEIGSEETNGQAHVQVATFEEPFLPSSSTQSTSISASSINQSSVESASRWIEQYLVSSNPDTAGSSYQPVSLVELLRQPIPVNQRSEMIIQYWETWSQWAELNSQIKFANWIGNISDSGSQTDVQLLASSKSQTENQVFEAKTLLVNSQSRLQSFMLKVSASSSAVHLHPLPSDNPLIHPYVTNYQLYRNYRTIPERFRNIDQELEDNLSMIVKQTQAVESARSAAESELNLCQGGRASLSKVIEAGQTWRLAEMNLIRTVAKYNQRIADYSLNVTDGSLAPETVAAILIGKSGNKRAIAGRHRPNSQIQSATQPPRTQNDMLNPIRNSDNSQSVLENTSGIKTPISSSLSEGSRQPSMEPRLGSQTFQRETNDPTNRLLQDEGRSLRDRTAVSPAAAQFGNLSPRPSPERNAQTSNSSRIANGNSSKAAVPQVFGASSGKEGEFNPSSRLPGPNQVGLGSGSAPPAKSNPLAPLSNPRGSSTNEASVRGANNPAAEGIDRFITSGSLIDPPNAAVRKNEGSSSVFGGSLDPAGSNPSASNPSGSKSGRSTSPNNELFRSNDFNPATQPTAQDANLKSSSDFNALPNETTESGAGQILPPDTDDGAGRQNDLDPILD